MELGLRSWRVEVNNRYFEDYTVLADVELNDLLQLVIKEVEKNFGGGVINSYLNSDTHTIQVWVHWPK